MRNVTRQAIFQLGIMMNEWQIAELCFWTCQSIPRFADRGWPIEKLALHLCKVK